MLLVVNKEELALLAMVRIDRIVASRRVAFGGSRALFLLYTCFSISFTRRSFIIMVPTVGLQKFLMVGSAEKNEEESKIHNTSLEFARLPNPLRV